VTHFGRRSKVGREVQRKGTIETMPNGFKTYTKEFEMEVVQLVRSSGKALSQVARDLGMADRTLHHWCKQFGKHGEQAFPGSRHQTPDEEA
jgi:transposase